MKCINKIRDMVEHAIRHGEIHTDRQSLLIDVLVEGIEDREDEINKLRKQIKDMARGVQK